ncbi:hypothetical protein ACLB2K_022802 [Fragaria x ananassa]
MGFGRSIRYGRNMVSLGIMMADCIGIKFFWGLTIIWMEALGTTHVARPDDENGGEENLDPLDSGLNESAKEFLKLMKGANQPLYPGSKKHTTLSFIVRILEAKWKDNDFDGGLKLGSGPGKRRATKQIRYFPLLKPRLQRLFMSFKTATLMRWHVKKRTYDGVFRHPADSLAWKNFDSKHSSFFANIRNVRLGLASDGFNPFRTMNIPHSTWPVILVPYNLPPTLLMKQPYIYLSVLIDRPQAPGDNIDVYLQPLIEELKELWEEGVPTFDASSNQMFQLHVGLLWTINDFPAYANLPGWSTKSEYACPNCNSKTDSVWLDHGHKWSFGNSRRFSPDDHKYQRDAKSFNDLREYRQTPPTLSGVDLLT